MHFWREGRGEGAQPLDKPYRQAQGPESVEGRAARICLTPLKVILRHPTKARAFGGPGNELGQERLSS